MHLWKLWARTSPFPWSYFCQGILNSNQKLWCPFWNLCLDIPPSWQIYIPIKPNTEWPLHQIKTVLPSPNLLGVPLLSQSLINITFIKTFISWYKQLDTESHQISLRNLLQKNSFLSTPTTEHFFFQISFMVHGKENDRGLPPHSHCQECPPLPHSPSSQVPPNVPAWCCSYWSV